MTAAPAVTFDLVVATVDRTDELAGLLGSLERQTHRSLRVLLADQNEDDRLAEVVAGHPALEIVRLPAPRGLSRARNEALSRVEADVVAFPDDDCSYPDDLLERLAARFDADAALDGVTGRTADLDGSTSRRWAREPGPIAPDTLWHRCNSASTFVRRGLVQVVGGFDESLGLGSGTAWSSGEEIDFMARALAHGARVEYDPSLVVWHPQRSLTPDARRAVGRRDGGSVGYVLGKNRYPSRVVARMLVRPAGGAALALARLDLAEARFNAAALRGRLTGYAAGRRVASNSAKTSS